MQNDEIEIACEVKHETKPGISDEGAYLIDAGTGEEIWIPKSMVKDICEDKGKIISIFLTEYIAQDKGLI